MFTSLTMTSYFDASLNAGVSVHAIQLSTEKRDTRGQLVLMLANEEYCINILKALEIRGYEGVTPIVNPPGFIKGVQLARQYGPYRTHVH
jgi:chemotaxis signal transduction protein